MNKKLLMSLLLSFVVLTSLVTASLYAEKIPDPSRFTSIEPMWSAELETTDGQTIIVSLIKFETLSYQGMVQNYMMFYLNDGVNEYIAEKGSYDWVKEPHRTCESGFEECLNVCADGDESCVDNCDSNFNCETTYTCETLAPDGTCGIEKASQKFGEHSVYLDFDPSTGQLRTHEARSDGELIKKSYSYYDDQLINRVKGQSGFLSEGVFSLE